MRQMAERSPDPDKTGMIGLIIPNTVKWFFNDPYFPRLAEGITKGCNEHGYMLSLLILDTKQIEEKMIPRLTQKGMVDGFIIHATGMSGEALKAFEESEVPYIIAGRPVVTTKASMIDIDNVMGAYDAVTHLIRLGRKRIATITGALSTSVVRTG